MGAEGQGGIENNFWDGEGVPIQRRLTEELQAGFQELPGQY